MGNAFTCIEKGFWDPHPDVSTPYKPTKETIYHDMNLPLSHYFISSGHNSYLTGDQLTSNSGTKTIEMCLLKGCRVIELDVYNEEKSGEGPVCKHGGTMTKACSVRDCVRAIKEFAFKTTPFPAIITIENHTSGEQQDALAKVLLEELGDTLFIPTGDQAGAMWLSPEALNNKVLIRANSHKLTSEQLKSYVYIANTKFTSWAEKAAEEKCSSSSLNEGKLGTFMSKIVGADVGGATSNPEHQGIPSVKSIRTTGEEGDDVALESGTIQEVYAYSSKHMLRVYPAGWRVGSSNYNPTIAWSAGACFAALNWQNWDEPLWINEGFFKDNGQCGYLLKPDWMRDPSKTVQPSPKILEVHVYSAHMPQHGNIMCYKDDVYVKLMVEGSPRDRAQHKTLVASNSGRLTVEKSYTFNLSYPDIDCLLLNLMDEDAGGVGDDCIGYFALPLSTMAEGEYKIDLKRKQEVVKGAWIKVKLSWVTPNPLSSS